MKNFTVYLSGGMSKYGKENFDMGDSWRRYCKKALETYDNVQYKVFCINPNNYFNFTQDPPLYESQREVKVSSLIKYSKLPKTS